MLVFYSPDSLERLANAQTFFIFMDGTFSVAPHPFKQLYTILVPFKDVTGTAVYAFLPNKCQNTYRELFQSIVDNLPTSNLQLNVQTLKIKSFVQLQLYVVATLTTRVFLPPDTSIMANDTAAWFGASLQERRRLQTLLWYDGWSCLFTIPDLTNGIHLLRTLCPDDPPEAAKLLDYFDSTYISGRLRQQNPAHNQAVRLVLTRSPPMLPPAIWNVHDVSQR